MADKEYIERGALIASLGRMVSELEYAEGKDNYLFAYGTLTGVRKSITYAKAAPAADVVSLDDVREAFQAYILEMTCSKYGTPEETQFARDIVRQAVDIVLGEWK